MATRTSTAPASALDSSEDSRRIPARAARYHYAAMRRAEGAARGLSVQHSVRMFAGGSTADEIADLRARRDSYYLLAAAHRAAGRKRERAENRTLAWAAFREGPAAYIGCTVRSWAYSIRGAVSR
ncbi:hypothetical protein [Streptomyces sp. NBC_00847]|uniref:hypothetical protein n=1 Tax=Streptomyces sp. NBC_00847 TaxID=2975850 RepID=UPI00225E0335|nr:hypothetical protein [Streptomyces sp. NBC_00847]MCX4885894.1 hypothetical protein [Streptomyces sp. NBC_00847]